MTVSISQFDSPINAIASPPFFGFFSNFFYITIISTSNNTFAPLYQNDEQHFYYPLQPVRKATLFSASYEVILLIQYLVSSISKLIFQSRTNKQMTFSAVTDDLYRGLVDAGLMEE